MTKHVPRQRRHHKEHRVRQGKQLHDSGAPLPAEDEGLRLPRFVFNHHVGYPFVIYPKGWRFHWLTPGRTALLVIGGSFALMVLCVALAKLLAG